MKQSMISEFAGILNITVGYLVCWHTTMNGDSSELLNCTNGDLREGVSVGGRRQDFCRDDQNAFGQKETGGKCDPQESYADVQAVYVDRRNAAGYRDIFRAQ